MEPILELYKNNETLINFIKDNVYFLGVVTLLRYLWNWNYTRKTALIELNLRFRERIECALEDYIVQKNKNGIRDIGIRFVHWKNYPWYLNNDGYKHLLKVEHHNNKLISSSWINNTGIYFQEHLWFKSYSIYVDKEGIFFFAPSDKQYKGFIEYPKKRLVVHLPFTKIVNFDFREIIEYEPVFYIRYHYTNYKKIYSRTYEIREKFGDEYFSLSLDRRKHLLKYSWIYYKSKLLLLKFLQQK